MLLEAGFISLFLAPPGILAGIGSETASARAAILLLLWEWFRIYFESGVVKLASGDPTWRNLTAMYEYYQNGPLPTWIGWYVQHLPHWFHRGDGGGDAGDGAGAGVDGVSAATLADCVLLRGDGVADWGNRDGELYVSELPGAARWRFCCWTIGFCGGLCPARGGPVCLRRDGGVKMRGGASEPEGSPRGFVGWASVRTATFAVALTLDLLCDYGTGWCGCSWREAPLPLTPVVALEPFRIANQYGLFAVMTPHRYEIEFQGSNDGENWVAYPFRYKPQDVRERPRIYAPYQPRFDWNLWFASLGSWQQNPMVPRTEELLLEGDRDVLGLFGGDPFPDAPPRYSAGGAVAILVQHS